MSEMEVAVLIGEVVDMIMVVGDRSVLILGHMRGEIR